MKRAKNEVETESLLIWGPWQKEIRATLDAARPILDELSTKVDRIFLKYLLREQTWIALKYPDSEQRKIEKAWIELCRRLQQFLKVSSEKASRELEDDLQKRRAAVEATGTTVTYWPKVEESKPSRELTAALKTYSDLFMLPSYENALERKIGGRPDVFWSDAVAFAMKEHFRDKAGSPKWPMISRLLKCAPSIPGISMEQEKIRQRLVRLQREEREPQRFKSTVRQLAYEFTRQYSTWDKTTPCPSLFHSSTFRAASNDTSLSENVTSAKIEDLHKKYKTEER